MADNRYEGLAMFGLLAVLGILSYLLIAPFFGYIVIGVLFAFIFYPVYRGLHRFLWSSLASAIVLVIVLLCIVVPSIYFGASLVLQATNAYQAVQDQGISVFDESSIIEYFNAKTAFDIRDMLTEAFRVGRSAAKAAIPGIITGTGEFLLGTFLLFFVLYYTLKDGDKWWLQITEAVPLRKVHRDRLREKLVIETQAIVYGQLVTTILIGALGGAVFWFVGIPNPIFWGFVMILLGLIPVLGAPFVYVPAGIWLLMNGNWIGGAVLLIVLGTAQVFIDNILRPAMVSSTSEIHPVTVVLGAIGGIYLLGFVGFLLGPLILSIFFTLLSFDYEGKPKNE